MSNEYQDTSPCGCDIRHPLQLDGTSQIQRLPKALDPSYVKVDERRINDLLDFALRFASKLVYYNNKNEADGNWKVFLENDLSVLIALVSKRDITTDNDAFRKAYSTVQDKVNAGATPTTADFQKLFTPFVNMIHELDGWYKKSDVNSLFHNELNVFFQSIFLPAFAQLRAIDKAAADPPMNIPGGIGETGVRLNPDWNAFLTTELETISSGSGAYNGNDTAHRFLSAAAIIDSLFQKFLNGYRSIIDRVSKYLDESLNQYPAHKAHAALFIAFLELFAYAQQHINSLTQRHLEFFYSEVLQLAQREAIADKVHVIFELARQVADDHKVPEGTLLKAGKDATGKELFYATDDEIIVSRAQIALVKNVLIDSYISQDEVTKFSALFAASDAMTSDGVKAELDKDVPSWSAFGASQQTVETTSLPEAQLGFAIASPQLFLSEGLRKIYLRFQLAGVESPPRTEDLLALFNNDHYLVEITTKKGWTEVDLSTEFGGGESEACGIEWDQLNGTLSFAVLLDEKIPSVEAYNLKAHGGTYNSAYPIIRIRPLNYLVSEGLNEGKIVRDNPYRVLKRFTFGSASIDVEVKNMKNLVLHNDSSKIDTSKPFMPFGQQPVVGSAFYIGSEEVFFKKVDDLKVTISWLGAPDDFSAQYAHYFDTITTSGTNTTVGSSKTINNTIFTATATSIEEGKWNKTAIDFDTYGASDADASDAAKIAAQRLFDNYTAFDNKGTAVTSDDIPEVKPRPFLQFRFTNVYTDRADAYDVFDNDLKTATRGYMRLSLNNEFYHSRYPIALAKAALNFTTVKELPLQPYTPVMGSFRAEYKSAQVLDNELDTFYLVHPFGEEKISFPGADDRTTLSLVPQYDSSTPGEDYESMMLIALSDFDPKLEVSQSILVQVVEDSGDPNLDPPEIQWSYLRNNVWVDLTAQQVVTDTTQKLLTSGIVELVIPRDATNDNTIMPSGYHWIRAALTKNREALPDFLKLYTQAIQASFSDKGNDPQHLATALPAGSITKPAESDPDIKGVTQPYGSFGGKVREKGNDYYRRVSERLRHKGRAITAWDYERLVLENFPTIYKAKCISHTINVNDKLNPCYRELAPGNTCVIVVSNLRNQNQVDLLQPSTSIALREDITAFLKKRSSKFVNIHVINPDYSEIQISCKVKYYSEFEPNAGYYDNTLIEDIKRFLSPWAYDDGKDIVFGAKVHQSYIINFIEEREYVDYLTDFTMYLLDENGNPGESQESIEAINAKTILVSAKTHKVEHIVDHLVK